MNGKTTLNQAHPEVQRKFMAGVYFKMVFALAVTAACAYFTAYAISAGMVPIAYFKPLFYGSFIAELAIVLILSFAVRRLSPFAAFILYFLYAAVTGVTFSTIFFSYTGTSIVRVFAVSALMFLGMSIYGAFTKTDLRSAGRYLMMALIGVIVASLFNFLFKSATLDWILSLVGIGIFTGLTAYDTQKILTLSFYDDGSQAFKKYEILGALELYLDFINIFIKMLSLFGKRK